MNFLIKTFKVVSDWPKYQIYIKIFEDAAQNAKIELSALKSRDKHTDEDEISDEFIEQSLGVVK
jgi:hypothetical protein